MQHDFQCRWNKAIRRWEVRVATDPGHVLVCNQVTIDAPGVADPRGFISYHGYMRLPQGADPIRNVAPLVEIRRTADLPGRPPKHDPQLEWCVVFDEDLGQWSVFRWGEPRSVVVTRALEINAYGLGVAGMLHFHSEMLLDGASHRADGARTAKHVKLRTLTVYDQTVAVPAARLMAKARPIGG